MRVRDRSYLGDTMQYTVVTPWDQEINVRMNASASASTFWSAGDEATLSWDASRGMAYQDPL